MQKHNYNFTVFKIRTLKFISYSTARRCCISK